MVGIPLEPGHNEVSSQEYAVQSDNKVFEDIGKLATSALGVAQNVREEVETLVRQRLERAIAELDVVSRDEFEAVFAMAQKAREENEELRARIDALEAKLSGK